MGDVTRILDRVREGEPKAAEELLPLVYEELRQLAARKMAQEAPGQTLQPTALVHEAWLRLAGSPNRDQPWNNRAHFFAAAAEAMRRILVENARRKRALRHGGGQQRVDLAGLELAANPNDDQLIAVHEALEELARLDARQADMVKLRFFGGLPLQEIAALKMDIQLQQLFPPAGSNGPSLVTAGVECVRKARRERESSRVERF